LTSLPPVFTDRCCKLVSDQVGHDEAYAREQFAKMKLHLQRSIEREKV